MATKRSSLGNRKAIGEPSDTRALMRQTFVQKKISGSNKIDHPLAKYNKLDQLSCAICLTLVKNDASWKAHLLSRNHKENVEKFKRGEAILQPIPSKASSKSIIALQYESSSEEEGMERDGSEYDEKPAEEPPSKITKTEVSNDLPADFFDSDSAPKPPSTSTTKEQSMESTSKLPEGFFDDAKQDAKVRKVQYKDKFEDVWQDFQKEIAKESEVSRVIADEDDDKLFINRDVDEIDEEIFRWSRVEALHDKFEKTKQNPSKMEISQKSEESSSENEDADFSLDIALNWRKKKF